MKTNTCFTIELVTPHAAGLLSQEKNTFGVSVIGLAKMTPLTLLSGILNVLTNVTFLLSRCKQEKIISVILPVIQMTNGILTPHYILTGRAAILAIYLIFIDMNTIEISAIILVLAPKSFTTTALALDRPQNVNTHSLIPLVMAKNTASSPAKMVNSFIIMEPALMLHVWPLQSQEMNTCGISVIGLVQQLLSPIISGITPVKPPVLLLF